MSEVQITEYGPAVPPAIVNVPAVAEPVVQAETVAQLEPVELAVDKLRAVLMCAGSDETRYYLNGVFVHRTADGFVRAVATDGHRMMVANLYREYADKPGPAWLDKGVIVPADGLAARLTMIAKTHGKLGTLPLTLAYAIASAKIELSDAMGANTFRLSPIDGQFPDYQAIAGDWSGESQESGDWMPTGFHPQYLKSVADIANRLGAKSVECYAPRITDKRTSPALFTFSGVGGVAMFLMPVRTDGQIAEETRQLLAPSIKLTLAALKAHETRQRKAAKKATGAEKEAALAKAEEFKARIEELVKRVGTGEVVAALPAPQPAQPEPEVPEEEAFDITEALAAEVEAAPEEPPVEVGPVEPVAAEEQPQEPAPIKKPRARKTTRH